jgi:hypothetical protein
MGAPFPRLGKPNGFFTFFPTEPLKARTTARRSVEY